PNIIHQWLPKAISNNPTAAESLASPRSVTYCCGSCGYALNRSFTDRDAVVGIVEEEDQIILPEMPELRWRRIRRRYRLMAGSDSSDSVSGNERLRGRNTLSRLGLCSRHLHLTSQVFLSLPDVHGQVDITYAS
ncbi:unnamed protein product, partial [Musa acuminata subsp. burmannicoides]